MQVCFDNSEDLLDVPRLRGMWRDLQRVPRNDPDAMWHGDLQPGNVLVHRGRLAGLLDGGGYGPADPALDLVCCWNLLDSKPRDVRLRAGSSGAGTTGRTALRHSVPRPAGPPGQAAGPRVGAV